ncbi:MAG: Co2+/Mg2+ efflux protein ApaG [Gammaproteobacteria bacterium]|nr:Co2+/Mg2+ efflux protein ApaG [Gammaproteobacteria bacterium]MDX2487535.1 Co2+/Mg2+ efflux protein ApaG [Gammaproteobacteria bacterium]
MSNSINVDVDTLYIESESSPVNSQYVFAYTITITNDGTEAAKLMTRHWVITDANGHIEEVRGDGVVGEQPYLKPGEGFQYTSGAVLKTPVGTMSGSYRMVTDNGSNFDADIPEFILSSPRTLH